MRPRRRLARDAFGAALILMGLAALGAFAVAGIALRPPPVSADTLCRTDQSPSAHTIILIDATDRLEQRHRRKLRAVADQERARLTQYDRLSLVRLNPRRPQEPTILFSKCLPREADAVNPLFENPRMAQEHWDASFADAFERALRSAQSGGAQRASPILAGLRAIAADPDFGAEIAQRRIVLISDLLEHDPQGFSLYDDAASFEVWRANAPAGPAELSAIDVRLVPLDRPDHAVRQAFAFNQFWPAYFDAASVRFLSVDPAP